MRTTLCLAVLALLVACKQPPRAERLEKARIGRPPAREVAMALAQTYLDEHLPEPATTEVVFGELRSGWYYPRDEGRFRYAWELRACVDGVNAFGLRPGARFHHFYFLEDRLVATATPAQQWYGDSYRERYVIEEFDGGGKTDLEAGLRTPPDFDD